MAEQTGATEAVEAIKAHLMKEVATCPGYAFAEVDRLFPDEKGDLALYHGKCENIIFWVGLSKNLYQAITELLSEQRMVLNSTSTLVYLVDGRGLKLPLAKQLRQYKAPHWAPVTLHPGPAKRAT